MASVNKNKPRRQTPLVHVNASECAKQFSEDFYADGGILFCEHSVDYKRVDTVKDHLQSKKHVKNKTSKQTATASTLCAAADGEPPMKQQVTLTSELHASLQPFYSQPSSYSSCH